jgi:hypothetical protein
LVLELLDEVQPGVGAGVAQPVGGGGEFVERAGDEVVEGRVGVRLVVLERGQR